MDAFEELHLNYDADRFVHLQKAVESSYKSLSRFRELYRNLVECYAGPAYGEPTDTRPKYINKMQQTVDAYTMLLAANRPKVDVTTQHKSLRPFATHFEAALNNMIAEIGLEDTIRRWVLDAFFCVGIVKVHLKDSLEVEVENNLWMDPGTPFASNVSLFDFVCDMTARSMPEVKYAGNMYQVTVEDLEEGVKTGMYDVARAKEVVASSKSQDNTDRLEYLTRETQTEEFRKSVDLADIWVARDRKVYTFVVTDKNNFTIDPRPIAEMAWDEADHGPYHILGFNDVPDNIIPVSPASHLNELDRLINSLYRKSARQAQRQKTIHTYLPSAKNDANNAKKANDGEMIGVNQIGALTSVVFGGADPTNMAFLEGAIGLYDGLAGNLPVLLGLGQQAETLGQEQLIHNAGSRKVGQMQYRVLDAVQRLLKSLGFLLWQDEFKEVVSSIPVAGDMEAMSHWKPGDREGNFLDYNFAVNIYSMTYRSPAQQAEAVTSLLGGVYAPFMEMLMQQGGMIDFAALTDNLSELLGIDWLPDIIKFQAPPAEEGPGPETTTKSPVTTRNYNRRSTGKDEDPVAVKQQQWQSFAQAGNQSAANKMGG